MYSLNLFILCVKIFGNSLGLNKKKFNQLLCSFNVSIRKLKIKYIAHILCTRWHLEYLLSDFSQWGRDCPLF